MWTNARRKLTTVLIIVLILLVATSVSAIMAIYWTPMHILAMVSRDLLQQEPTAIVLQISMSVRKGLQNATLMPLVLTLMGLITVAVSMDTLEMDGTAQVWHI